MFSRGSTDIIKYILQCLVIGSVSIGPTQERALPEPGCHSIICLISSLSLHTFLSELIVLMS